MNENIRKFYDKKMETLEKAKKYMTGIFETEEQVELAVDIFRTRYELCMGTEDAEYQARYTSNQCLNAVFRRNIDDDVIDRIQAYDCLRDHINVLEGFLNDDTAVLIEQPRTVGMDDYNCIVIGSLSKFKDGLHQDFWMLSDEWIGFGYGMPCEISDEKKEKVVAYWKEKGML